jgi:hypothetical protein
VAVEAGLGDQHSNFLGWHLGDYTFFETQVMATSS